MQYDAWHARNCAAEQVLDRGGRRSDHRNRTAVAAHTRQPEGMHDLQRTERERRLLKLRLTLAFTFRSRAKMIYSSACLLCFWWFSNLSAHIPLIVSRPGSASVADLGRQSTARFPREFQAPPPSRDCSLLAPAQPHSF